jgi:hypothetical protein
MTITRKGNLRLERLRGECPYCRCRVLLNDEDREKMAVTPEGVQLVACPTTGCDGRIVVQMQRGLER